MVQFLAHPVGLQRNLRLCQRRRAARENPGLNRASSADRWVTLTPPDRADNWSLTTKLVVVT